MSFPFNIYLAAGAAGLLVSALALPLWRRWSLRVGLVDDPGHRKIHASPIPLAGGLAVLTGVMLPLLVGAIAIGAGLLGAPEALRYGVSHRVGQLGAILVGAVGMTLVGALDDKIELRPAVKFFGQFLMAALVAAAGIRITLFVPSVAFSFAVTVLWILTVTNALNFLDNMNGLCAGLGAIGAWACAWSGAVQGQYLVATFCFLTFGALVGFLPYNFPRATSFLGDAGSHLVGFLMATLSILPSFYSAEQPSRVAVLAPLIILAVPLGDMAWVVMHRWRKGQPFYVGDTNHISHRLTRQGLSSERAVLAIWLLAAASAAAALLIR
jgi:UDP-GlcNAc:undecaprenyl-phosphate/decaprenyl-phosphate GlcNAc-1-phosphate transferase